MRCRADWQSAADWKSASSISLGRPGRLPIGRRFATCPTPALLLLLIAARMSAVIVDRVAVTVGNKVITDSEIDLRLRLTAFQNGEKPDFSAASKRAATKRLVDQRLVEREMDVGHYPHAASGKALVDDYVRTNFKADRSAMVAALHEYGLTEQDLEEELTLQADMLTFLNLRFRPAVQVTDEDVVKYFDQQTKQAAQEGTLSEVRGAIEQKLTGERADRELDAWLQDQRKRTKVEYNEKDLEEKAP
jgi:hypothetical protein